jgi:asparagine synthase (glutamine-hydrolysing)
MCGICGIYNAWSQQPASDDLLARMAHLIDHRGPDDRGSYLSGPIALGMTRLSIIDLSGGHQPMSNEDGTVWLVFNGEIWNYQALRRDLIERGHRFRTRSDTETIVHAYDEYGLDCLTHLHGMFAFALWDSRRQRLLLARDRVGKKPLYYARAGGGLIFASEIKSLLCHPDLARAVNPQGLVDFLNVRYVPGPDTLFANIYKVLPGHWLVCENGEIRQGRYWDFTFQPDHAASLDDHIEAVRGHIRRGVEERMMADVPVGALLSGGVDSSIITGLMSEMTDHPVQTFSVGFDKPDCNELPYAELVSRHFGTEHHPLLVHSTDLTDVWPLLTWHRDDPVSEPSDLGVYLVSKLARQHVKVILTGEGGDELFAGYPKYAVDWLARYYHLLPAPVRDGLIQQLLDRLPYQFRKAKFAARTLSRPAPERWLDWFGVFDARTLDQLLAPGLQTRVDADGSRAFRWWLAANPQPDDLSAMLYLDTKIWLPDNLLMKSDKMTMAASIEARVPLLDAHLIEYAARIPSAMKIKLFRPKYLLKRAYAGFLPDIILTRKKMGFNMPLGAWFQEGQRDLISRLLLSERSLDRGLFQPATVARLVNDHINGRTDYGKQLFILASLELWFRVFIDNTSLDVPRESVEDLLTPSERQAVA